MARGKRIPLEEKIKERELLIVSLTKRLESVKAELKMFVQEKERRELSELNELLRSTGMNANDAATILKNHAETSTIESVEASA